VTTYRLEAEIGRGALGRVVRVVETESGRIFAGKLLHDSFRDDPRARQRFAGEARLLEHLTHENIVRVEGLAMVDGREVILMELVDGPSLQAVLARAGALPERRIVPIARGIARGLQAAHAFGLIHRDLKPANILLAPGEVAKLVDFGLARTTSLIGVDPTAFALVGTPDYMPPESIDPLAVDSRSDLYALGCLLFEMTAGRPPFGGASAFAILEAHQRAPVPDLPPTAERSPGLIALIGALLSKSPADRPQSAATVVDALDALGQERALVVGAAGPASPEASCTDCGAPLLAAVAICFGCGRPTFALARGRFSLFVVGPGQVAEKLDASLRQVLVDWLLSHPQLGLAPDPLARRVPRLPFLIASGIGADSAHRLAEALRGLGLRAEVRQGGALSLPDMRRKAWKLSGRAAAIVASFGGGFHLIKELPTAGLLAAGVAATGGFLITGLRLATRPVTDRLAAPRPLSAPLANALAAVVTAVPAIQAWRHRDSLRSVVSRLLAVERALGGQAASLAEELAGLALGATEATLRLDRLEQELVEVDLRNPEPAVRARLHERDRLASRLLDTAARLDGLRARLALAGSRQQSRATAEALGELRREVDALEEVAAIGTLAEAARR
jgi:hypothetical protein